MELDIRVFERAQAARRAALAAKSHHHAHLHPDEKTHALDFKGAHAGGTGGALSDDSDAEHELRNRLHMSANRFNVRVNGRRMKVAERALGCLRPYNPLRFLCLRIYTWVHFDKLILALILINSVMLATTDYGVVDPVTRQPVSKGISTKHPYAPATSTVNALSDRAEPVLLVCFTLECIVKILSLGLIRGKGTYLHDAWNWLDIIVVITGWISTFSSVGSVSVLRSFRILRPLRTLTTVPRMRLLVVSLLRALPALGNVFILFAFVVSIFSILGVQLFAGAQYNRCRLTEWPIAVPETRMTELGLAELHASLGNETARELLLRVVADTASHPRCADELGQPLPLNDEQWTQQSSPWHVPRQCMWPLDFEDHRLCSASSQGRPCAPGRTCGSNYDTLGNARFANANIMRAATFVEDLNFGFTQFTWMMPALASIFQVITMEGWVHIMYQLQDATNAWLPPLYFILLIVTGSFWLLRLALAVIWDSFDAAQEQLVQGSEPDTPRLPGQPIVVAAVKPPIELPADARLPPAMARTPPPDTTGVHALVAASTPTLALAKMAASTHPRAGQGSPTAHAVPDASSAYVPAPLGQRGDASSGAVGARSPTTQRPRPDVRSTVVGAAIHAASAADTGPVTANPVASAPAPVLLAAFSQQNAHPVWSIAAFDHDGPYRPARSTAAADDQPSVGESPHPLTWDEITGAAYTAALETSGDEKQGERSLSERVRRPVDLPAGGADAHSEPGADGAHQADDDNDDDGDDDDDLSDLRRSSSSASSWTSHTSPKTSGSSATPDVPLCGPRWLAVRTAVTRSYSRIATLECSRAISRTCARVCLHPLFDGFIVVCILANTVAMSTDAYPPNEVLSKRMELLNFALTLVFIAEMVLKLCALGAPLYSADAFNRFDAFIVVVSCIELATAPPNFASSNASQQSGGAISVLRTFRLFRLFKLARSWKSLQSLLLTMAATLSDVANFSVLLFLFMFIQALLGMQLFANKLRFDPDTGLSIPTDELLSPHITDPDIPRANFDSFLWAFATVFQAMSAEGWNVLMYDAWRAQGWTAAMYYIVLIVLGQFIILNLFLAILLGNFDGAEHDDATSVSSAGSSTVGHGVRGGDGRPLVRGGFLETARAMRQQASGTSGGCLSYVSQRIRASRCCARIPGTKIAPTPSPAASPSEPEVFAGEEEEARTDVVGAVGTRHTHAVAHGAGLNVSAGDHAPLAPLGKDNAAGEARMPPAVDSAPQIPAPQRIARAHSRTGRTQDGERLAGTSLWLFSKRSRFRRFIFRLSIHPKFDNAVLILILISSMTLAIDSPLADPDSPLTRVLATVDLVLTVLFATEALIKVVAQGFLLSRYAYLRNPWNVLDFVLVSFSVANLFVTESLGAFRVMRVLRALRPLRVIKRNEGMRLVVAALLRSVPSVLNVVMVSMLFFLIFAIVAQNYFKGALSQCAGPGFRSLSPEQQALVLTPVPHSSLTPSQLLWNNATYTGATSKAVCLWLGASWERTVPQHFDNVFSALSSLVQMSTTEGWVGIMVAGVDSTGVEMQPRRDAGEAWILFFILFMVVGSFFVLNLFVGVVLDNFQQMKDKLGGMALMSDKQQHWAKATRILARARLKPAPPRPHARLRALCWDVVVAHKQPFDVFIAICILVNAIVMAAQFFGQPVWYSELMETLNSMFAIIFTVEAALKLLATDRYYFLESWNVFDFVIVVGTWLGVIVQAITGASVGALGTVVRAFRVGRILRLARSADGLRVLFNTLITTLPALANVASILLLLIFMYAILGVQLFSKVAFKDMLNDRANFRTFGTAFLTLIRCATGEEWNELMYDVGASEDNCVSDPQFNSTVCGFSDAANCIPLEGCGSSLAFPFFFSFTLMITFVMLNLFIGIILDGFSGLSKRAQEDMALTPDDMEDLVASWQQYDPAASYYVSVEDLELIMAELQHPLGFAGLDDAPSATAVRNRIRDFLLPTYKRTPITGGAPTLHVYFIDVALALARRRLQISEEEEADVMDMWSPALTARSSASSSTTSKPSIKRTPNRQQPTDYSSAHVFAAGIVQMTWSTYKFKQVMHRSQAELAPRLATVAQSSSRSKTTASFRSANT